MIDLIFLLLTGSVLAYISKYNLEPVTVNLGKYTITDVPLFYIIVGSLLIGLVISFLMQIFRNVSNSLTLRSNKKVIKSGQNEVLELTKRVHQLELENEKIKNGTGLDVVDTNAL